MPCHDILVQGSIQKASWDRISATEEMWQYWVQATGMTVPVGFRPQISYANGSLGFSMDRYSVGFEGSNSPEAASKDAIERYQQAYVAKQIFDGLAADGYGMHAEVSPESEGTWLIRAHDESRNATIGVTVYRDMSFEIDFLDALHDDSVWLTGGEFGRVLEYLKAAGLGIDVIKTDIDWEMRRQMAANGEALYA